MLMCLYIFRKILYLRLWLDFGIELLSVDAYLVHHFINEMVPLTMLPPLDEVTQSEIPVEEDDVSMSTDSDLEVLGEKTGEIADLKRKGKKVD